MGEYFKGWRRRLGVVTLVMACVFAAGWVRCSLISEQLQIRISDSTVCAIASGKQSLSWLMYNNAGYSHPIRFYSASPPGKTYSLQTNWPDPNNIHIIRLPYWSIVLPLTLLSAWLLLGKPIELLKLTP
jgi:hypothetical protein